MWGGNFGLSQTTLDARRVVRAGDGFALHRSLVRVYSLLAKQASKQASAREFFFFSFWEADDMVVSRVDRSLRASMLRWGEGGCWIERSFLLLSLPLGMYTHSLTVSTDE